MKEFSSVTAMIKNEKGEYEGIPALRGVDSYELAVKNGFKGSEEEWLESVIGDGWIGAFQQLESRTVNGKPLSADVELTADDIPLSDTVSELEKISASYATYITLVSNITSDGKEAALGKNNENNITGAGRALAMYENYISGGNIDIKDTYHALCGVNNIKDLQTNIEALNEIAQREETTLLRFLNGMNYTHDLLYDYLPLHSSNDLTNADRRGNVANHIMITFSDAYVPHTLSIPHCGWYSIKPFLRSKFNDSVRYTTGILTVNINGTESQIVPNAMNSNSQIAINDIYLTPEDVVTVSLNSSYTGYNGYAGVILYNTYSGSACVANPSGNANTSKLAFGKILTTNSPYAFPGPSGYYRVRIPKWMVGCNMGTNDTMTVEEFSLKFGDEALFSVNKTYSNTGLDEGEYDEVRYIEHGEEIILTLNYTVSGTDYAIQYGSWITPILFYNSTGPYPHLYNIKPIGEASE